jgi:carbohydrate ABC transporter substrate-binding protein, CUT1 family (TC 3.A.1.1.-)
MVLTACGGGGSQSGESGDNGSAGSFEGTGPFTYVQGKDNGGTVQPMLDTWNEAHPDEKVTLIELSTEADQQRQAMINNAQTQSDAYCVMSVDNIWVPEFAARGWIDELPESEFQKDKFLAPAWETGTYRDKVFAIPASSDGGLLYYRKDILAKAGITEAPTSWEDMEAAWEKVKELPEYSDIGGYAGQFYKYEGFTVNVSEAINTSGGVILDADLQPASASAESEKGLQRLVDGFDSGFIPQEALTYKEEEGRAAFEAGRIIFYRNWPYQYSLTQKAIGDDAFGFTSLPTVDGNAGVSSLGGHNLGISSYCQNKASALEFVKWYSDGAQQQTQLKEASLAPVWTELYEDEANIADFPYLPALEESIKNAVPRPRAVQYGDTTAAIQDSLWPVLQGQATPADALKTLDEKLAALGTGN